MKRKNNNHNHNHNHHHHPIEATPVVQSTTTSTTKKQKKQKNLPKGAEYILKDENKSTSYEFQLYNFAVGILFLAFGLSLISGTMMLVNLCIAFVHLDLGLDTYNVSQLWHRVQIVMGLCGLVFLYLFLLHNAGESIMAEGFTGPGMVLLIGVVGAETHLWDICSTASRQQKEQQQQEDVVRPKKKKSI